MGKLGKETKKLLLAITIICLVSFLLAVGISFLLTKNFQHELLLHDYGVSGYQLNHEDELQISAFTSLPNENDIERGREALASIGYDETTSMRFLPAVQTYRNQTVLSIFALLVSCLGQSTYRSFSIFNANTRLSVMLKIPSVNFWTVIPHPVSNVHKLATGTAFFMPSMKWRLSSLLMLRTRGRQKNFCRTLFRMYHIRLKRRCLP